jgi:preprotein translocase subunit SecY
MKLLKRNLKLKQEGHVTTEWTLIVLMVFVMLFAPIPGMDKSLTSYFMDSIRDYHKSSSYIYSLP